MLVQAFSIYTVQSSIEKSRLGAWNALSALLLSLAIFAEDITLWFADAYPAPRKFHVVSSIVQFVLGISLVFTSLSIPRRPEIFSNEKVVDREHTVSLLSRFTFSWPAPVLDYAKKNRNLTTDKLPVVAAAARARNLQKGFDAVRGSDKLWKQVFWSHSNAFFVQWTLQVVTAITNFLPQITLYVVLRLLEARDAGQGNQLQLWLVAVGMGLAVALGAWLESMLFYVCFLKLGIPIYEQLSAVIFGKALRKKDVKSAAKVDQDAELKGEFDKKPENKENEEDAENDDEEITKSKQSTINLIGVDSKRISDFATFNYLLLGSVIKLIVAINFLIKLLGWKATLCGFAAPLLVGPANWILSKKYGEAQDDLMKYRDQKMAVVTEALQGIRQIKFSALEQDWYERILKTRRKELNMQWRAFYLDTGLISIWIFGPVCMSALSLAAYAFITGGIQASVAFTAFSVFEAIEMSMSILPEMVTDLMDAITSERRLQQYLSSAERNPEMVTEGDALTFAGATIAWPSDDIESDNRLFTLEDLNIKFAMGELNVISGRTGSGKSLLLSAIIGEADVLEGKVIVPRPPPLEQRFDHKANKTNWIIQNSIAYVSQIPWIENATFRDNILFGLPFDEDRYKKVLAASALEKDLEILQDGDMTDIGANGINLSGGQKWRASFARALYSRAGILVLDDIFSAVDAHVGRQLYENALTGELCNGRTRVLVTHHVALCLPKTSYIVMLENGRATNSGPVDELKANGSLNSILSHDAGRQQREEQAVEEEETVTVDDGGHNLARVGTNQSRQSRRFSTQSQDPIARDGLTRQASRLSTHIEDHTPSKQKSQPKKFTEEEGRETGSINFNIYKTYIKACRGYMYWAFLGFVFVVWIAVFLGRSYWVSHWTRQYSSEENEHATRLGIQSPSWSHNIRQRFHTVKASDGAHDTMYYISIYLAISLCAWIVGTTRYFLVYLASIRGSRVMFEKLANAVLRAPLRFLDTTPVGRLSNRFTSDFNMIDSRMANDLGFMLHCGLSIVTIIIAGVFVSPFMLLFAVILLLTAS